MIFVEKATLYFRRGMELAQEITECVLNKSEQDFYDYKSQFYAKAKMADLIKDVAAFSNNTELKNKHLIFGVNNDGGICGIDEAKLPDISSINQLLNDNVDPFIDTHFEIIKNFNNTGLVIASLVISKANTNYPYLIKKDYNKDGSNIVKGTIFLRKGATNMVAERSDLDKIYSLKKKVSIEIIGNEICLEKIKHSGKNESMGVFHVLLNNTSEIDKKIKQINITFRFPTNIFTANAKYIEPYQKEFNKVLLEIKDKAQVLPKESQLFRSLYLSFSDNCLKFLIENSQNALELFVQIVDKDERIYIESKQMKMNIKEDV